MSRRFAHVVSPLRRGFLALAVLSAAALAAWRYGIQGNPLRIREVRFEGLKRIAADELLELSPVQRGDNLLFCDTALMEAALRRHPWISRAEVRRSLPPAVDVRVAERRAAAIVDLGALYLVSSSGELFKRAVPGDGLDLPVITGIGRDDWIERRGEMEPLLRAALALLDRWTESGLDRRAQVSEIHIDADRGTTLWALPGGLEIRLGRGGLPEKLSRLDRVLDALEAEGRKAEVLHLDNRRHPEWVTARLAIADVRATGPDEAAPERGGRSPFAPPR